MKIENLKQAQRFLRQKAAQYGGPTRKNSVIVGYTAAYALRVHEELKPAPKATKSARNPNRQGKYLEQPARELANSGELDKVVVNQVKSGASLEDALLVAGQRIQAASQKLVPVDTGNLRASAFCRKESSNNASSTIKT